MNRRYLPVIALSMPLIAASTQIVMAADEIDRSANFNISYVGAPAAYDPPFSKNQFQETPYMFPVYDTLVRLDAKGNLLPDLATSWETSSDGKTITFHLRKGVKFTDGSDFDAAVAIKSLNRAKSDPNSLRAGQLASFASFEAPSSDTVVARLSKSDANALYTLSTSSGMIVSAKAIDGGVDLANNPVGTGPYKLVSSGPQGANYVRNEDYFDKSQNQFAKLAIIPIADSKARLNAVLTGQLDAGIFQAEQSTYEQIQSMVKSGNFTLTAFPGPNSVPVWFNTKIKPLDDPKVRMALNLAVDRQEINQGLQGGVCQPASQPLQPGVIGHDDKLIVYKRDVAKAKQLLKEAGVGPFTMDMIIGAYEPYQSIATAIKAQLKAIDVDVNIQPTSPSAARPLFRAGKSASMLFTLSVPAPDPASILDAAFLSPDLPGGISPELAKAIEDARTKKIGTPEREAAYKAVSKMAYDNPNHILICWSPALIVSRKGIVGIEKTAYINAVPIPDVRTYSSIKK